jgi:hypothetical protein
MIKMRHQNPFSIKRILREEDRADSDLDLSLK